MNENNPSAVRVGNWTLATGTRAGERHVYPRVPGYCASAGPSDPAVRRTANCPFVNGARPIVEGLI
jgi:hypothetical protein